MSVNIGVLLAASRGGEHPWSPVVGVMEEDLVRVSLRQRAVFVPRASTEAPPGSLGEETAVFVANLARLGYGTSEGLLRALDQVGDAHRQRLMSTFRKVMNVDANWTPLVKNWLVPTGESVLDHVVTFLANVFELPGPRLPCGHVIPAGTFPLERYNGCPFCGTPFDVGAIEVTGQSKKLKVLDRWDEGDVDAFLESLLKSRTALDATQIDSLQKLLAARPLPAVDVGMKETLVVVIDHLIKLDRADEAQRYFTSPTDVLRYLWYKHTGFLQIVDPATIIKRHKLNAVHEFRRLDGRAPAKRKAKAALVLKYGRRESHRVARWLDAIDLPASSSAEIMHPLREMWVRFIRALRLAEYARRPGFERLKSLLDVFYREAYDVWQGKVDEARLRGDLAHQLSLLQQRPGLFARALFASMLRSGPEAPLRAFAEIVDRVPARLVVTLAMYATEYFDGASPRIVKPLGGVAKTIAKHPLLQQRSEPQLAAMISGVEDLALLAMKKRFAALRGAGKTMYIEPPLFKIPLSIGDRSEGVQDMPAALMGTRFPVEGNAVRLFMHWGVGLPAMHLDMDLSAAIIYPDRTDHCSYFNLAPAGCKHSGDIRAIPEKIGTAEYIELDLDILRDAGALYCVFGCNAYSAGALSPSMSVGWMTCEHPMVVSVDSGVAYDPSCVQHQLRIQNGLTKGLAFGVLEVAQREIVWMELPFGGQTVLGLSKAGVEAMLRKLGAKLSIGNLLKMKAEAQGARLLETQEGEPADEVYTMAWARNAAAVTQLLPQ